MDVRGGSQRASRVCTRESSGATGRKSRHWQQLPSRSRNVRACIARRPAVSFPDGVSTPSPSASARRVNICPFLDLSGSCADRLTGGSQASGDSVYSSTS
jgi:hypothetical protein